MLIALFLIWAIIIKEAIGWYFLFYILGLPVDVLFMALIAYIIKE